MEVVVNGQRDSLNNGNMLMVLGLAAGLRRRCPGIALTLLSDRPDADRERYGALPGLTVVPRPWRVQGRGRAGAAAFALGYLAWAAGGVLFEKLAPGRMRWPWDRAARAYRGAAVAVDLSGDDLTAAYGPAAPLQVLYEAAIARLLGCRTALVAHSAGPFAGRFRRAVARLVGRLSDVVTFRDGTSRRLWRELTPPHGSGDGIAPELTADLMHLAGCFPVAEGAQEGPVLVNVSRYTAPRRARDIGGTFGGGGVDEFCRRWAALLGRLHGLTSREIVLFPHVFRDGIGDDRLVLDAILARCPPGLPVRLERTVTVPAEAARAVAGSSFVIASRMHLALTALRCGVPCLALAYSHKFDQLSAGDAAALDPVLDLATLEGERRFEAIRERFTHLWERRETIRRGLAARAALGEELAERNIDILAAAFGPAGAS